MIPPSFFIASSRGKHVRFGKRLGTPLCYNYFAPLGDESDGKQGRM
ncbi:MAG: hypothetical protein USCGTAYLOR_02803 [Chromatiales bacterium USCg_Taylor]|nr:MAG: hypothetical protein USCGTAYLOR_02803 [Chromatiales bacterium USCg_Taylor]